MLDIERQDLMLTWLYFGLDLVWLSIAQLPYSVSEVKIFTLFPCILEIHTFPLSSMGTHNKNPPLLQKGLWLCTILRLLKL